MLDVDQVLFGDSFLFVFCESTRSLGRCASLFLNILLWTCDLTEVIFIHSPNNSLPFSRIIQSVVKIDVIGPFWWGMNEPSSLTVPLFLDS